MDTALYWLLYGRAFFWGITVAYFLAQFLEIGWPHVVTALVVHLIVGTAYTVVKARRA